MTDYTEQNPSQVYLVCFTHQERGLCPTLGYVTASPVSAHRTPDDAIAAALEERAIHGERYLHGAVVYEVTAGRALKVIFRALPDCPPCELFGAGQLSEEESIAAHDDMWEPGFWYPVDWMPRWMRPDWGTTCGDDSAKCRKG